MTSRENKEFSCRQLFFFFKAIYVAEYALIFDLKIIKTHLPILCRHTCLDLRQGNIIFEHNFWFIQIFQSINNNQ